MQKIYLTEKFKKKLPKGAKGETIRERLETLKNLRQPEQLKSVTRYSKGVLVYKLHRPNVSRIIIQPRTEEISGHKIDVLYVRDILFAADFGYNWGTQIHPLLSNGDWLSYNPLDEKERQEFITRLENENEKLTDLERVPDELTSWLRTFDFKISFDVFERERWVKFASSRNSNGLQEKDIDIFRETIRSIISEEGAFSRNVIIEQIPKTKNTFQAINKTFRVGVIFSRHGDFILIHDGANTLTQKDRWDEVLLLAQQWEVDVSLDLEQISRDAFRAYPKWILNNTQKHKWEAIQRHDGYHNLSLLPEQVEFLKGFSFPSYINGQAGSGKSTMLYYLFSNVLFYKFLDQVPGDIIFLTENENLLETSSQSVIGLLSSNPEFDLSLSIEKRNQTRDYFSSFINFLLNLLPEEEISNYPKGKFLDFATFKNLYSQRKERRKFSAEEVWFVLSTYVYGYYEDRTIETASQFENEDTGIPRNFRIFDGKVFEEIIQSSLPFYKKLIEEGRWDKRLLVRKIREFYPSELPRKYSVVFCDEAQDFSRIELKLILDSSEYLDYDLGLAEEIPLVFAGDALQTVNPTGFSPRRLHEMFYQSLKEVNFDYNSEKTTYKPTYNYRSVRPIVRIANVIQFYRKEGLGEYNTVKQTAKREGSVQPPILHFKSWISKPENKKLFLEKFQFKSFIVPVELNGESKFIENEPLLNDDNQFTDIKSSIDAKGAEYSQVVVFGFGDYYVETFGRLGWEGDEDVSSFEKKFFFNKLYVAVTRAQNELVIIDSEKASENFWKPLFFPPANVGHSWESYGSISDVLLISPESGLKEIKQSSPDDALKNATIDMEQGVTDKNIARLIVASNTFVLLGEISKANICLGYKELILEKWESSAKYFFQADEVEKAASALFLGQNWDYFLANKSQVIEGNKQIIRILVARLMVQGQWDNDELEQVYSLRKELDSILREVSWIEDFFDKLIFFSNRLDRLEPKRNLAYIIEGVVREQDVKLKTTLGKLYYDNKQYDHALEIWDSITEIPSFFELFEKVIYQKNISLNDFFYLVEYIKASIEKYIDEEDDKSEMLFRGMLLLIEPTRSQKIHHAKVISKQIPKFDFSGNLNFSIIFLWALVLNGDSYLIESLISEVEKLIKESLLSEVIAKFIYDCKDESISILLKERWARAKKIELISRTPKNNEGHSWIEALNEEFLERDFPFHESNLIWSINEVDSISELPNSPSLSPPQHIHNVSILNFKKFEKIDISELGQFNLILGDNNSGKTTLLEAFLFDPDPEICFLNYLYAFQKRNNNSTKQEFDIQKLINFQDSSQTAEIQFIFRNGRRLWHYYLRHPSTSELFESYETGNLDVRKYIAVQVKSTGRTQVSNPIESLLKDILEQENKGKIPFIPFGKGYSETLASTYQAAVGEKSRKERDKFADQLRIFIPNISEIIADTAKNSIVIVEEYESGQVKCFLQDYGEGANKLFRILIQIYAAENGRLMIDEIDAGIHYSRFKKFWEIILKVANNYNVQLFATTHNAECIQYFREALNKEELIILQSKSRVVTLQSHFQTGKLIPLVRNFERMTYAYENYLEIRGEK